MFQDIHALGQFQRPYDIILHGKPTGAIRIYDANGTPAQPVGNASPLHTDVMPWVSTANGEASRNRFQAPEYFFLGEIDPPILNPEPAFAENPLNLFAGKAKTCLGQNL
jgi:hypothetical protein